MTEYIIIVALIAVSAIGVYTLFGSTLKHQVAALSAEMSGGSATAENGLAGTQAQGAATAAATATSLANYGSSNDTAKGLVK